MSSESRTWTHRLSKLPLSGTPPPFLPVSERTPWMCFPILIGGVLIQIPEHCPAVHVVTVDGQIPRFSQNTVCLEEQTSIDVVVSLVIPPQIILRFFRAALQYRIIDATLRDCKPTPNIRIDHSVGSGRSTADTSGSLPACSSFCVGEPPPGRKYLREVGF